MRAAAVSTFLIAGAAAVLVGSCYWAWATRGFWRPIPLYPTVLAAGLLATVAVYVHSGRRLKAASLGMAVTVMTLVCTAVITLLRWHI